MGRPFNADNALHRDRSLGIVIEKVGDNHYFAVVPVRPTTPTILRVKTSNANWTPLATGLTGVLNWKVTELNGNNFYYAYVVAPGNNFSVGFGWISFNTGLTDIHIKRPAGTDVDCRLERWTI